MLAVRSARAPEFYRGARRPAGTRCQQPDRIARDPTTSSAPDEDRALDAVIVAICRSVQEPLESQWASAVIAASFEPHIDVANFKAPRRITPLESLPDADHRTFLWVVVDDAVVALVASGLVPPASSVNPEPSSS
jgi:hypothetical protein